MKKNGGQRRYLSGALGLAAALGIASIGVHCTGGGANPSNNPASTAPRGELPGSSPRSRELSDKLSAALTSKGAGYKPRTAHTKPDGSPKYTNRLILEASPYLLQHAHNPVDWYPWGDEAFAAARRENKPVFLSVGYSTCHWCHVMERESFENDEIAAFINEHYIAIKVDREERPDVDALYMAAVQALSGGGGWPMTVIMTPDREPFFAGTYFPAKDGDRGAKRGLSSILKELAERYLKERSELVERAGEVTKRLQMGMGGSPASGGAAPSLELVAQAAAQLGASFDSARGGFGGAPKFPRSANIELLLRHHRRTREPLALAMAVKTLDAMAAGGIFDHIGGGFHRYSTDAAWLIPHFEKMLYDNAQLAISYLEAYQATGSAAYAGVARRTLDYVLREMTSPEGGFFSATDADSEGEEGKFFVWTPAEIAAALGPERLSAARAASAYFGVTPKGNFEGKNILFTPRPMGDVARDLGLTEQALSAEIEAARALLYTARARRVPPLRDDKILTSWNGLMIAAMARGGFVLAEPRYLDAARRASERLFSRRATDGRLVRNAASASGGAAYLDDYAFFIAGLLELQRATGEVRWLSEAIKLQALLDAHYWDSAAGGYFTTADDAEKLFARDKPDYDGAEPSGSSVAIDNLCALAEITSNTRYVQAADRALAAFSAALRRAPRALPRMLTALDRCAGDPLEIAIVSPANPSGDKANLPVGPEALLAKLRATFVPGHTLLVATEGKDLEEKAALAPLLEQKTAIKGITTAYVCRRGACKQPTSDPEVFAKKLAEDAQP